MKEGKERLRPSTIIWDLDDTLLLHEDNTQEVKQILQSLGYEYSFQVEYEFNVMLMRFNSFFSKQFITRDKISTFLEEMMPALSFLGITGKQFLKAWIRMDFGVLNPEAKEILELLVNKGKKNIILTDWILESQARKLLKFDLLQYIEEIHSCENNYLKCNSNTISGIVKEGQNEEYMIIGDSLTSDIAFADKANIASVWYNKDGKVNNTEFRPTFECSHLLEILEFIS